VADDRVESNTSRVRYTRAMLLLRGFPYRHVAQEIPLNN